MCYDLLELAVRDREIHAVASNIVHQKDGTPRGRRGRAVHRAGRSGRPALGDDGGRARRLVGSRAVGLTPPRYALKDLLREWRHRMPPCMLVADIEEETPPMRWHLP
jgi:hypothetical protein